MTSKLDEFLKRADAVMNGQRQPGQEARFHVSVSSATWDKPTPTVHVGVDLGTAYTVLAVLDAQKQPLAGAYRFAQVVRDGLVVDFHGAISLLTQLKQNVEAELGFELSSAATTYPPGVPAAEVRATRHVLEAAGFGCEHVIDEPTAANAVLGIADGAVVDVGGGTTGVAVFQQSKVVYAADEPTGGTHFSLVIAGALDMSFEAAEIFKRDPGNHAELFPIVRPVMEKVATIVTRHIAAYPVDTIYLVGGTACFGGIKQVMEEVTGRKTIIPVSPMFVTPLGVAMYDT